MIGADASRHAGFTLVELVVVIVVSGVLAAVAASFISRPIQGAVEQDARAALVDQADLALRRVAREIHRGLPNSVRVQPVSGPYNRLEIIRIAEGASYRSRPGSGGSGTAYNQPQYRLNVHTADDSFNVLGSLTNDFGGSSGRRIAIYPTDADTVYQDAETVDSDPTQESVITPADRSGFGISANNSSEETRVQFSAGFDFRYDSPQQRLYVTDTPVSFVCDSASRELLMYWAYPIRSSQPTQSDLEGSLGASRTVLARNVDRCQFTYVPGAPQRAGLVTLDLGLSTQRAGVVRLLHQVHVVNTP